MRQILSIYLFQLCLLTWYPHSRVISATFADEAAAFLADTSEKLGYRDSQSLLVQLDQIHDDQSRLFQDLGSLNLLVKDLNIRQVQVLINTLTHVEQVELARRKAEETPVVVKRQKKLASKKNNPNPLENLSPELLQSFFDAASIVQESDTTIENWIHGVMSDEATRLLKKIQFNESIVTELDATISTLNEMTATAAEAVALADSSSINADVLGSCTPSSTAALQVYHAIQQYAGDGIGKFDHATTASIVMERTSSTFQPPMEPSQFLGNAWWSRFIPDDWERVLPSGWREWNALPVYIAHSMGLHAKSRVAPPSAILQGTDVPGSCWPMAGSSGRVTLLLPYPVKIDGITIDHASSLLMINMESQMKSAPKKMTVYGYPPCQQSENCGGIGFDVKHRLHLTTFEYNENIGGTQTFGVGPLSDGSCEPPPPEVEIQTGSCSASPMSTIAVSGIELVIHENWGHPEFTCLYRFRVHGETESVSVR